jgi:hypothetical protein
MARFVAMVVQRDKGLCWICGHWGSYSADHIIPVTEDPSKEWDLSNAKAAHAWPRGCTDCTYAARQLNPDAKPVYCNSIKGGYSVERARRIISERTGLRIGCEDRSVEGQGRPW